MDIALRKDFKEIIAAIPVVKDLPADRKVKIDSNKAESSHESCGKSRKDKKKVITGIITCLKNHHQVIT